MTDLLKQNRTKSFEPLAAGTYLVGDPCYAFDNDMDHNWQNWLADAWKDVDANQVTILDGRINGMRIVASGTAYGDGTYTDQDGYEYPVDAGLLGAVHIGFLANLYPKYAGMHRERLEATLSMRIVEFDRPFHVSFEDGTITIGHITIETGDDAESGSDWLDEEEDPWN